MTSILSVDSVSKKYCRSLRRSLWYGLNDIVGDLSFQNRSFQLRPDEFLALDNVSFDLAPGESLALIGRNGAGKSTLLKLINGLFAPDFGQITVDGSVSALIELGAGFSPVLTGRENIYINASVLGLKKKEVDRVLDEIIDFSELSEFIDSPLKSYSSGMKVRLGFSIAAQIQPSLLLIDEVLAVGDAAFRAKCYRRLAQLQKEGTAFVLVSHNKHMLLTTCKHGVVLNRGVGGEKLPIEAAVDDYDRLSQTTVEAIHQKVPSNTEARIEDVWFESGDGRRVAEPQTGEPASMAIAFTLVREVNDLQANLIVRSGIGSTDILFSSSSGAYESISSIGRGKHVFRISFDQLPFVPGNYVAKLSLSSGAFAVLDGLDVYQFRVSPGKPVGDSLFFYEPKWYHEVD